MYFGLLNDELQVVVKVVYIFFWDTLYYYTITSKCIFQTRVNAANWQSVRNHVLIRRHLELIREPLVNIMFVPVQSVHNHNTLKAEYGFRPTKKNLDFGNLEYVCVCRFSCIHTVF